MIRKVFGIATVLLFLAGCSAQVVQPVEDFPINPGQVGPIHPDNPRQQPFACATNKAGLGDPLVDNQNGIGQPVKGQFLFIPYTKGFSENCGVGMRVEYYYRATDKKFYPLSDSRLPEDISYIDQAGERIPFVVRFERGVINRFIYGISMLASPEERPERVQMDRWNRRLIFMFHGGVRVGRHQSGGSGVASLGAKAVEKTQLDNLFNVRLLAQGYALMASTGTTTDTSFHLPLLGQTAMMLKQQFETRYGAAELTLGFGGSGGSIQQLYNARTQPGLLDGMILSHMFPDLLTQINGVGDCELLEYYFDRGHMQDGQLDPFWKKWKNRSLVEGFNAIEGYESKLSVDGTGWPMMSSAEPGSSVCVEGWHAATQLVFNPNFFLPYLGHYDGFLTEKPAQLKNTHWTHWDDEADVYGRDKHGYGRRTFDNVGVQYGLNALRSGQLTTARFLHLNARVGGWFPSNQMKPEVAPYYPFGLLALDNISFWDFVAGNVALTDTGTFVSGLRNAVTLVPDERLSPLMKLVKSWLGQHKKQSIWSHQNMTSALPLEIAPRAAGDELALARAQEAELVFDGKIPLPTISILPYLENELNIHDARQPFVVRERMRLVGENPEKFSIWGVMPGSNEKANTDQLDQVIVRAVAEMERWLGAGVKPDGANDACWSSDYQLIARGSGVWRGAGEAAVESEGICARQFPIYKNPRGAAGESLASNVLKCELKSVDKALNDGTYAEVSFSQEEQAYLKRIFPEGVCNYASR